MSVTVKWEILELCLTVTDKWDLRHYVCLMEHYSTIPDSNSKMEQPVLYPAAGVKWDIRHYICL